MLDGTTMERLVIPPMPAGGYRNQPLPTPTNHYHLYIEAEGNPVQATYHWLGSNSPARTFEGVQAETRDILEHLVRQGATAHANPSFPFSGLLVTRGRRGTRSRMLWRLNLKHCSGRACPNPGETWKP